MTSTFYRAHEGGEATIRLVTDRYQKQNIFPFLRDFHVNRNTTLSLVMQLQHNVAAHPGEGVRRCHAADEVGEQPRKQVHARDPTAAEPN